MTTPTHPRRMLQTAFWALAVVLPLSLTQSAHAQGCVVAHGSGLALLPSLDEMGDTSSPWDVSVAYRWFKSHRHYVGTVEQKQRAANGDQVINKSNFVDFSAAYTISPRYNVDLTLPFVSHDRSQVVKNASGVILDRFSTQATGIGDASVIGNAWVFDPTKGVKGNLQLGLGLSLPTGNDRVSDVFETFDKTTGKIVAVRHNVDQSIQPGSGGYGIILSTYGYHQLGAGFTAFGSATYTITPQEENGVQTARSNQFEAIESIPDTYLLRAGVEYMPAAAPGWSLSLGLRDEGVMVRDLIGGSKGFRRPGYSIALEPGIGYSSKRWSTRFYLPYAIKRDRLQSVPDKQTTALTGKYSQGDAAFADYLVMWTLNFKL